MSIGSFIITLVSIYQEKLAARLGKKSTTPEGRLYFPCVMSILLPIGLFWFGWTTLVPYWIVPALAVACATMGIFSIYLAVSQVENNDIHVCGCMLTLLIGLQLFCRVSIIFIFQFVALPAMI